LRGRTATWQVEEGRKAKFRAVLRRRWLLSLFLLLVVVGLSTAVSYLTPATYTAEALMNVPAISPGNPPPGNPDGAAKLAKTYATAIPSSPVLIQLIQTRGQVDNTYAATHLLATNDAGTSLVRLSYVGTDPKTAADVVNTIATRLASNSPPPPVTAGALKVSSLATAVSRSGGDVTQGLVMGSVLGLIVAFAAGFALERTNPHVDGPTEVAEAVRVPVTTWNAPTTLGVTRLLRSWDSGVAGRPWQVALVPVGEVGRPRMLDVLSGVEALHRSAIESARAEDPRLNGAPTGNGANPAGSPIVPPIVPPWIGVVDLLGGDDIHRLETADTIVLVVAPGVSLSTLSSTARRLRNQGAAPAWSIFIPGKASKGGGGRGSTPGVVRHGDL
jgi:capsular polysaccharide biosynthesis protein